MAISTYKVFLMKKNLETFEKLIDIKDYPDLGGSPEMLDTTTLSDRATTSIPGIQQMDALAFTANYTSTDFDKIKALEGEEAEFSFKGTPSVFVTGGGVNEVVSMTVTFAASTPVTKDKA